ncbi:TM1812 family CRISPR-associated protein [Helicobacter sp. T3_23-1059]
MSYHILAILGLAGKDKEGNFTKATYSKDSTLVLPLLKNGEFHNSTHCLIDSFGENATYTFIGTSESIKYQNDIFDTLPQCKAIFEKYPPLVLRDSNEIEAIFHQIIESIKNSNSENIILDITHGFRHQPIIASFASTLAQINTKKSITLLFAKTQGKDSQGRDLFQYTSLKRYSQISLIALCLNTFVQTLSVPEMPSLAGNNLIKALNDFSKSLFANAFNDIFKNLDKALFELQKAKNNDEFIGTKSILDEVLDILNKFLDIKNAKKDYAKHHKIAKIMHQTGFYLIAATYIYEAIGLYIVDDFDKQGFINKAICNEYDLTNAVRYFVLTGNKPNQTKDKKDALKNFDELTIYRDNNQEKFESWQKLLAQIKRFRNDLAHIAKDTKYDTKNIGGTLNRALQDLEQITNQNPHNNDSKTFGESKHSDGALQAQLQKLKNH